MRVIEKIELINKISKTIQEKYDETDTRIFFNHFGINIQYFPQEFPDDSYSIDVKSTLAYVSDDTLIDISMELNVGSEYIEKTYPKNWENMQNKLKVFISHLSEKKDIAKKIKEALKPYNIECFVAHEDITPSLEWQQEITKALNTMDVFISLHCKNFCTSEWCQQEIGFAIARNVKIIPIKFDDEENPVGFISKIQGLSRSKKDRFMLAKDIVNIIENDETTKDLYKQICIKNNPMLDDDIPDDIPF